MDQIVQDDSEIQTSTVLAVYLQKAPVFLSLYKKYCLGLKRADCVLVSNYIRCTEESITIKNLYDLTNEKILTIGKKIKRS